MSEHADELAEREALRMFRHSTDYNDGPPREHPKCKHCGSDKVIWLMHKGKWRLHHNETGELHVCPPAVRAASDFAHLKR